MTFAEVCAMEFIQAQPCDCVGPSCETCRRTPPHEEDK